MFCVQIGQKKNWIMIGDEDRCYREVYQSSFLKSIAGIMWPAVAKKSPLKQGTSKLIGIFLSKLCQPLNFHP